VEEVQKNAIIFLNCLPGGGATAATTAKSHSSNIRHGSNIGNSNREKYTQNNLHNLFKNLTIKESCLPVSMIIEHICKINSISSFTV